MDFEEILNLGIKKNIINENQKNSLMALCSQNDYEQSQSSTVVKVLYYIGGFLMLVAMAFLMSRTIQYSTYSVIMILGAIYALLLFVFGEFLWRKNEKLPAGILYFLFIASFGFMIMDIEKMIGFFPHFSDMGIIPNYYNLCIFPTIVLSSLIIITNTILQRFRPTSLLALPTIFCSYTIYICILSLIYSWVEISYVNFCLSQLLFGLGLTAIAFIKDKLTKVDYSKWMYFFGAIWIYSSIITFLLDFNLEIWQQLLCVLVLSSLYILVGLVIQRKPFSIIGILGVISSIMFFEFLYIQKDRTFMTCLLLFTGLTILYAGVIYNKNVDKFEKFIESKLPEKIKKYLPQNRV